MVNWAILDDMAVKCKKVALLLELSFNRFNDEYPVKPERFEFGFLNLINLIGIPEIT